MNKYIFDMCECVCIYFYVYTVHVYHQVPTKKTKFLHSHVVDYFAGNKAVDLLMQVRFRHSFASFGGKLIQILKCVNCKT